MSPVTDAPGTDVVLVVADPRTSDDVVRAHTQSLADAGGRVRLVDLRAAAPREATGRPLPVRAARAVSAGWLASRGVRGADRASIDRADLVVAGDRFAIPTVWRARRRNRAGALVNGIPAAVGVLTRRQEEHP